MRAWIIHEQENKKNSTSWRSVIKYMWDRLCPFPTMELNCVWTELWTEPLSAVSDLQLVFHLFRETQRSESILPDSIMCRKLTAGNHRYFDINFFSSHIFFYVLLVKKYISNITVSFFFFNKVYLIYW